jgi:antibiotic biosynthesis monooxygenase (ABM) superfamily enzyme
MNMVTLLMLYPVVMLFGAFVQTPFLIQRAGMPFAVAMFIANVASILSLNYLIPWTSRALAWWLQPAGRSSARNELAGAGLLVALYALMTLAFWRLL